MYVPRRVLYAAEAPALVVPVHGAGVINAAVMR
jgi:hypothetical protein